MKIINKKNFLACLIFFIMAANTGYSEGLIKENSLGLKLNNKNYSFNGIKAVIRKRNNTTRIIIAIEDPIKKVRIQITAEFQNTLGENLYFRSEFNRISFTFISKDEYFSIQPELRFARTANIKYIDKNSSKYQFKRPEWKTLSKERRKSIGRGIVRNRQMQGTAFALTLIPVLINGKIVRLKGQFSGVARSGNIRPQRWGSKEKGKTIMVKNGAFNVEVAK